MYKINPPPFGEANSRFVTRLSDNACIPMAEDNTDYQEYLKWLAAGNQPIPANAGEGNEPLPPEEN